MERLRRNGGAMTLQKISEEKKTFLRSNFNLPQGVNFDPADEVGPRE
jgi:hypothetical protein